MHGSLPHRGHGGLQEFVEGRVVVDTPKSASHNGIQLRAEGLINLQLSARSVGLFEAFYSSIKPLQLLYHEDTLTNSGRFEEGRTEFPFRFEVKPTAGSVSADGRRATVRGFTRDAAGGARLTSGPARDVSRSLREHHLHHQGRDRAGRAAAQHPEGRRVHGRDHGPRSAPARACARAVNAASQPKESAPRDEVEFRITPESLENVRRVRAAALCRAVPGVRRAASRRGTRALPQSALSKVPPFVVSGTLHRSTCPVNLPLTGEVRAAPSTASGCRRP